MSTPNAEAVGLLQLFSNATLATVLAGEVDLHTLAAQAMAGRGLDATGNWVGFEVAAQQLKDR